MNYTHQESLQVAERALQAAMLAGDVEALDGLLHRDLLAVGPDGGLFTKADDLASHRAGGVRIAKLEEQEIRLIVRNDLGLTFVVVDIEATVDGAAITTRMRYTRTWTHGDDGWRVIGAHISQVN